MVFYCNTVLAVKEVWLHLSLPTPHHVSLFLSSFPLWSPILTNYSPVLYLLWNAPAVKMTRLYVYTLCLFLKCMKGGIIQQSLSCHFIRLIFIRFPYNSVSILNSPPFLSISQHAQWSITKAKNKIIAKTLHKYFYAVCFLWLTFRGNHLPEENTVLFILA